MELFQNTLAYFGQDHGLSGQYAGWVIAAFAVALTLSAIIQQVFPRPVADDLFEHPELFGDWPAPRSDRSSTAGGECGAEAIGKGHVAGASTLCSQPVDNS